MDFMSDFWMYFTDIVFTTYTGDLEMGEEFHQSQVQRLKSKSMHALCIIAVLIGSAALARSQPIYYATFTGENFGKETWHSSSVSKFKRSRPDNVYDSYTVKRHSDGSTVVHRDFSTPSGDWRFKLTYDYRRDGHLWKIRS